MRKIKFRAFIDERLRNVTSIHWDDNGQIDAVLTTRGTYEFEDYPDMILMQYVGVDSLGNDIYEGDVLLCEDEAGHFEGVVKYEEGTPAVTDEHGLVYYINIINDSVLLGNVYEINDLEEDDTVHLDELLENLKIYGIDTSMLNVVDSDEENHKMKYIKKPVTIKAIQFTRKNIDKCVDFTQGNLERIMIPKCIDGKMTGTIKTLESGHGGQIVTEGDFIIKGIQGEFYPCKPDIFYETYEKI